MAGTTTGSVVAAPVLKRLIKLGMQGADVKACKRAAARAGFPKVKLTTITDVYTDADVAQIKLFQTANGLDDDGKIGSDTFGALLPHMDAFALNLYASFDPAAIVALVAPAGSLVYPHPAGTAGTSISGGVPGGFHQTGGLPGNWALDFMAPGGTPFAAPEAATVTLLTGHDPNAGVFGTNHDVFGLSMHLKTAAGLEYFATHLGDRTVHEGQSVKAGDLLGHVGHWPNDPGRSHTHMGVTHPQGKAAAEAHIAAVAAAPHVAAPA